MGGLLDKANAAKDAELVEETPSPVKAETKTADTQKPVASKIDTSSTSSGLSSLFSEGSKVGFGLALLGFVLMWFLGSYTLQDLTGPVPFGLIVIGIFAGSFYLVWDSIERKQTVSLAIAYLLLAAVPYGAGLMGDGFVGITDIDYNEEEDELTFKIRGNFKSVEVFIRADGKDVWSSSDDLSNEVKNFRVPIVDFFAGNGEIHDGSSDVEYTIYAESSNGLSGEIDVNSRLVTRQVEDAGVRITALQGFEDNNEYLGVTVNLLVGLINPSFSNSDGGGFQATGARPMNGDYTIDVSVSGGDLWSENTITVDETTGTWSSQSSAAGTASTDTWIELTGTEVEEQTLTPYIAKEDFYDDPGCYSFTVDIVNTVSPEETFSTTWSWEINLESGDDEAGVDKGYGIGETC